MAGDSSAQAVGAWLHGAATGAAHALGNFNDWVLAQPTLPQGVSGLASGVVSGQPAPAVAAANAPTFQQAMIAKGFSPAAAQAHDNLQAMTAQDINKLGVLTPGAQASLQAYSPKTLAAAQTAQNAAAAKVAQNAAAANVGAAQPSAADLAQFGKLTWRQLGMLGDFALKTSPAKQVTRPMTPQEVAAQQYMQDQYGLFRQSLDDAKKNNRGNAQELTNSFDKKTLLPIILGGRMNMTPDSPDPTNPTG